MISIVIILTIIIINILVARMNNNPMASKHGGLQCGSTKQDPEAIWDPVPMFVNEVLWTPGHMSLPCMLYGCLVLQGWSRAVLTETL